MTAAYAHGDEATLGVMEFGWNFEPWVVLPIVVLGLLYAAGSRRLGARGQADRRTAQFLFWIGFLSLVLALLSPLHALGTSVFFLHMIEHEALMVVAVPLMVAARPGPALLWGMPRWLRQQFAALARRGGSRLWAAMTELWGATVLHAMALWVWHIPGPFQAALNNEALHVAQHLTFILSAILFWSAVMRRDARRSGQGGAIMALFLSSLQAGLLGALLTFSNKVWYPNAADPFPICGLTRAEDQALAGLVMWVPACTIYIVVALIMAARWLALLQTRHA